MKRLLFMMMILPLNLLAQTNGEVMDNVRKLFSDGDKAYSMNFTISSEGEDYAMTGILTLQGIRYRIQTSELEIYCDGENKWVIYPDYAEGVVMKNNLDAVDFVENPYIVFTAPDHVFNYRAKARVEKENGLYRIKMDSRSKSAYDLLIYVNDRYYPERIVVSDDVTEYAVRILELKEIEPKQPEWYTFVSDNEDFYVTDMR